MAEINAKDLTAKTSPASTDSMLLFGTTSNEGAKITVDNLADNILGRLATKTFPNKVGGSSAATILAQLATLNSNFKNATKATFGKLKVEKLGRFCALYSIGNTVGDDGKTIGQITGEYRPKYQVNVSSVVYAGASAGYVPCRLLITTEGYVTITAYNNQAIEGMQPDFFQIMPIIYYSVS